SLVIRHIRSTTFFLSSNTHATEKHATQPIEAADCLSINIPQIPLLHIQLTHVIHGIHLIKAAVLRNDVAQGGIDVFGHTAGVAADVKIGPFFQPAPDISAGFAHAILDINFLTLITGKGEAESGEMTLAHLCFQLVAIIKITGLMLLTEEQPVFTGVAACAALLQETAEGRNASTRSHHDDGCAA